MAAPTNSGESDIATEDFCLNLSPLLSPRWSPLCLTPSPPRAFLPSSNSMVMQYQGCNQSMYNPPQNQEHDDMVDPPPYLAGDSALLQQQQQQLRKNWSEASDWRPRGGGIMRMNNQGFEESNMGFEESMEMTTSFYFPPSPTNFPLYRPMPSVFFVSSEQENISLALSYQHILEDKSGALHVINWEEGGNTFDLLSYGFESYLLKKFGDLCKIAREPGVALMESLVKNIFEQADYDERKVTLRRINWLEQHDEDIVDQPVFEIVGEVQQLIQNRGCELDMILEGGVVMINGLEHRDCQGSPMTPETLRICQAKVSFRVWLRHGGQLAAELRCRWNRLNIGSFTTVEDAISTYELVARLSGWTDHTDFPGLLENDNRSTLPLQLQLVAQEEKPDEDFGTEAVGIGSERTGECVMVDQARLNSGCLEKRKTKEKNPRGERRNKETSGVKIAISLQEILQTKELPLKDAAKHLKVGISTLKRACREYDIPRWPPRGEHKLISLSHPNESPAVVDKEPIPQLNFDTFLPFNQVSPTIGTESVIVKARFGTATMKFQLSWPWGMVELKEQVKKRLGHEAENYYINYKDEDNEYIIIACDEDLQDHISRSNLLGTNLIEVFLQPK
ncbi:hypothetical protein RHMOL_Rhmol02G0042600 [Rhododendron molle]|uniref:Uncharacterized protein n=1 Tax=Rhododendron molle TaxID=49168 RepID=A0ACC0PLW5_RHOML|nr:hypothetical protein RHMOL_Rhmol02G0042600 [Rhododendron molle]